MPICLMARSRCKLRRNRPATAQPGSPTPEAPEAHMEETEATSPSPHVPPGPPPGPPEATELSPEATEEDPPPPPLPPPRPTRLPCSICKWRAAVLPPVGGGGRDDIQEEPEDEDQYESQNVHTPVHQMPLTRSPRSVNMQISFHQMPNEVWTDILQTQTLCRGQRTVPDPKGREWTFSICVM